MFDPTRIRAELDHIQRALADVPVQPIGASTLTDLCSQLGRPRPTVIRQALLADCVRLAATAVSDDLTVNPAQLARVDELLALAARHYAATLPWYGQLAGVDRQAAQAFVYRYLSDVGPFGQRAHPRWPGLALCRDAEQLRQPEALARYTRLMAWLIGEATQLTSKRRPRGGELGDPIAELRDLLGAPPPPEEDRTAQLAAFLAPTQVFACVQQTVSVLEADPFDVDTVCAPARRDFARVLAQAATQPEPSTTGNVLLLLGKSGSGKTHLLRSFCHQVQGDGRGFVAYAPLHTSSDDHARYLLHHVVDSLTRPYAGAAGEHTALYTLASGMIRIAHEPLKTELQQFTEGTWRATPGADTLAACASRLVDQLVQQHPRLGRIDRDLLRILLCVLFPASGMTSRIYRYLRCLELSAADQQWFGVNTPRSDPDAPKWMIRDLARFAYWTHGAPFVIMVDQAERAIEDPAQSSATFSEIVDVLHGLASAVPSLVPVVSYVSDVYDILRPKLTKSVVDRIEISPPPIRLTTQCTYLEIEAMVSRRLAWLYARNQVVYRPETPVYPFTKEQLHELDNRRPRDVLAWCDRFQRDSAATGRLAEPHGTGPVPDPMLPIAAAWTKALETSRVELPDDEEETLALIGRAAADCALELGLKSTYESVTRDNLAAIRVSLSRKRRALDLVIGWTQRGPQAGAFGAQIATLRKAARNAVPVAIRRESFPNGAASQRAMTLLGNAGGRCLSLDDATLRAIVVARSFRPQASPAEILAWRQRARPLSSIPVLAEMFELAWMTASAAAKPVAAVEDVQATDDAEPEEATSASPTKRRAPAGREATSAPS